MEYYYEKFEKKFSKYLHHAEWLKFCGHHGIKNTSKETAWRLKNRIPMDKVFNCEFCNDTLEFVDMTKGFRRFCGTSCSNNSRDPSTYAGFATPAGQAKARQTLKEKTGYEYALHNPETFETQQSKRYKTYDLFAPSGAKYRVQGYERFVVPLLWEEVGEEDLIVKKAEIPKIWYEDEEGNKRKYFPDAMIKSTNTMIEVKSEYTINDPLLPYKIFGANENGFDIEVIEYGNGVVSQRKTFHRI